MTDDAFGTAALRHAVAEAWLGSGTRFREDANTEEDHARGYYRDRVVVELAQNAADAAARAGVPGRFLLRLERCARGSLDAPAGGHDRTSRLVAANTGAPLDASGLASLASLRASAKTSGAGPAGSGQVGRFGVGFAAVRSVSDDVAVRSRSGGVRFSLAATQALLDDVTAAGGERADRLRTAVEQRGDALPVLRLPFPAPALGEAEGDQEMAGFDTVVELVLRDDAAAESVRAQLDAVDDGLLLALPALSRVDVTSASAGPDGADGTGPAAHARRTLADVGDRWLTERRSGTFDAGDLADLPLEQRRADWSLVWALPRPGAPSALPEGVVPAAPRVLHAPTPTDVPLTFPALLVASFPVDPGRRQVQPGPATARLAAEAGRVYAGFLARVAAAADRGTDVLGLVPTGLPASDLDAAIRDAATDALRTTPLLAPPRGAPDGAGAEGHAGSGTSLVAPSDAVVIIGPAGEDEHLVAALVPVVPGLVAVAPRHHAVARSLGATTVNLADVVDELPDGPPPHRWHAIYAALEPHASDAGVLEALAGARVPLADGRTVTGLRGTVVLPEDGDPVLAEVARTLGVRVVHPDAAHPLLTRAGAARTDPRSLLADAGVRAVGLAAADALLTAGAEGPLDDGALAPGPVPGVDASDDAGAQEVLDSVLALVRLALPGPDRRWAEAHHLPGMPFWLGELPVATDDGNLAPLRETTLPGTWAAEALDALAPIAPGTVARYGAAVLAAAGAHADLAVYTVPDVVTPDADELTRPAGHDADDDEHGPDDPAGWLDGWSGYLELLADRLGPGVPVGDVEAVADLDAVADGAWPAVLLRLADEPHLRQALLGAPRTRGATAPSYTAWWLRERLAAPFALHDGVPLLPPAPAAVRKLDDDVRRALGGVDALADLDVDDWPAVLDRLPAVGERMALRDATAIWRGLAGLARTLDDERRASALDPLPERLPALDAGTAVVHPADDLEVAGGARWAQLGPVVPAPPDDAGALADLLDLPVVGEDGVPAPDARGERTTIDPRVTALDDRLPGHWWAHEHLAVDGTSVGWWLTDDGEPHAKNHESLANALAETLGRPALAPLIAQVLADPAAASTRWAATAWEPETS